MPYKIDNDKVYYDDEILGYDNKLLEWVDWKNFSILNEYYWKTNNQVFFIEKVLEKADPKTFEIVKNKDIRYASSYAKDKNYVFYEWEIIEWINTKTFEIIDNYFIKDENNVFIREYVFLKLNYINPNWFEFIIYDDKFYYVKDKNSVYLLEIDRDKEEVLITKIINSDINTFEYIWDWYSRDKNNIYYNWEIVIDFNPAYFKKLSNYYIKDDKNLFYNNLKIKWVNINNISVLDKEWWYIKDDKNVYFYWSKIIWCDANTFTFIKNKKWKEIKIWDSYDYFYIWKDKNYIFIWNEAIENADVNTFEYIKDWYSKDKDSVFYYEKEINLANPKTFEVLEYWYSKDDKNVYYYWELIKWFSSEWLEIFEYYEWKFIKNMYKFLFRVDKKKTVFKEIEWINLKTLCIDELVDKNKEKWHIDYLWEEEIKWVKLKNLFWIKNNPEALIIKDINSVYLYNYKVDNIIKVDYSDPKTFHYIWNNYFKDKNNVYYWVTKLDWINPDNFNLNKEKLFSKSILNYWINGFITTILTSLIIAVIINEILNEDDFMVFLSIFIILNILFLAKWFFTSAINWIKFYFYKPKLRVSVVYNFFKVSNFPNPVDYIWESESYFKGLLNWYLEYKANNQEIENEILKINFLFQHYRENWQVQELLKLWLFYNKVLKKYLKDFN